MTITWIGTVFVAALFGSLHCAAMCGPLAAMAGKDSHAAAVSYQVARLTVYVAIGSVAGLVGWSVDLAASRFWLGRVAFVLSAATLVSWGLVTVYKLWQLRRAQAGQARAGEVRDVNGPTSPRIAGWLPGKLVQIKRAKPRARGALIGLLTGLLPCGWLWSFAVLAAGTAHPLWGAVTMAIFALGSAPSLFGIQWLTGQLGRRLSRQTQLLASLVMIVLGIAALGMRTPMLASFNHGKPSAAQLRQVPSFWAPTRGQGPSCH